MAVLWHICAPLALLTFYKKYAIYNYLVPWPDKVSTNYQKGPEASFGRDPESLYCLSTDAHTTKDESTLSCTKP